MGISHVARSIEQSRRLWEAGGDGMAYVAYAEGLLEDQQYAQALDVCRKGLDSRPSLAGRRLLASIYLATARYDESLETLQEVLREAPEAYGANLLLVRVLAKKGLLAEAHEAVSGLVEKYPGDPAVIDLAKEVQDRFEPEPVTEPVSTDDFDPPDEFQAYHEEVSKRILEHSGVSYCKFLSPSDGNILDEGEFDSLMQVLLHHSSQIADELGLGRLESLMLDYDQGQTLARWSGYAFLVAQFSDSMPAGRMRGLMARYLAKAPAGASSEEMRL